VLLKVCTWLMIFEKENINLQITKLGYPFVATMAESFSIERRKLMRMYGAKVIITPKELKGTGYYERIMIFKIILL
jgi:cysteine synthase